MRTVLFFFYIFFGAITLQAQNSSDTSKLPQNSPDTAKKNQRATNADDPANFFTRIEVFNELQHYKSGVYLNQAVLRTIVRIGKRFTTRLDLPFVYNSRTTTQKYKQSGLGDITFRVLGFKFFENPTSAVTASLEVSLNTAQSPLLGTGKNLLIPVVSYTRVVPKQRILLSLLLQQANSISGDEARAKISFTKVQFIMIKTFPNKIWAVLAPEWYIDYVNGGVSMNLRTRLAHAPTPRLNIWITPSVGVFGNFAGRYQWSLDVGGRYFLMRDRKSIIK